MSSIPTDQWYVAAYGREVGRSCSAAPSAASRSCSSAPARDEVTAMSRPLRAPPLPAVRGAEPPRRRHSRLRLPRLHLRRRPALRLRARPEPDPAHRARLKRYPVVEQDSFVWVWIGDPARPTRPPSRGRRWLASPGWTTVSRHGAARRAATGCSSTTCWTSPTRRTCTAATSAPPRSPRRRSPPRSTRARHRRRQPAHGRRRVPAVLRQVHRHRGPHHPLAGHRVPPAVPVPAAQPDRAGRRAARPGRQRPGRLPRRGRLRHHPGDRARPRTTSGRSPATSPSTTRRSRTSSRESNRTVVCRTSPRSTCWSR